MGNKKVQDVMTSPAITMDIRKSIKEAASIFKEKEIGFLPITKNNIIVGVLTDRDIVTRSIGIFKLNTKIEKIMTNGTIHFVSPSDSLLDAAKIMSDNKIRRLPVLNDGYVIGVITSKDLIYENELLPYIINTYNKNDTIPYYQLFANSNLQESVDVEDYPL